MDHSYQKEREHFDYLVLNKGISWWGHQTKAGKARLIRRASLASQSLNDNNKIEKILEIGCGIGDLTQYLAEKMPQVHIEAIDISDESIKLAQRKMNFPNVVFSVADTEKLPFESGSFDAVVGNSILHHINLEKVFPEIKRVLKRGGRIFFSEPNMLNPEIFAERNIRFIGRLLLNSPEETAFFRWNLSSFLVREKFSDIKIIPYDFLHPLTPSWLLGFVSKIGEFLEKTPLLKEFSGSLAIQAKL